jgi:hypothetical protein
MIVTIQRRARRHASTIGELSVGDHSCFTLEPPVTARSGEPSCIRAGQYVIALDQESCAENDNYQNRFGERHRGLLAL